MLNINAELLGSAQALSFADRDHFELNLAGLLDKSMQHKRNCVPNLIAARQRLERQQTNFEDIQTLSIANSKLMVNANNLVLPHAPSVWARLSP